MRCTAVCFVCKFPIAAIPEVVGRATVGSDQSKIGGVRDFWAFLGISGRFIGVGSKAAHLQFWLRLQVVEILEHTGGCGIAIDTVNVGQPLQN